MYNPYIQAETSSFVSPKLSPYGICVVEGHIIGTGGQVLVAHVGA